MSNTDHLLHVTQAILDLINENRVDLGLELTFYGDQDLIQKYPAVCVDGQQVDRELQGAGAGGGVLNTFTVFLYVYHGTVKDIQQNRKDADKLVADLEDLLHTNLHLSGEGDTALITHGFVVRNEAGQAARGEILAVTRMTWQGLSKTLLGVPYEG